MHDLVIENASIIDGTGRPAFRGGVGVSNGRIVSIGEDVGGGRRRIDAEGLALMPGIIDNHTHYDAQITWDPHVSPSPALGVTTVVMGNCGFTIAPCRPDDRDLVMRNLTHVEGMSLEALRTGIHGNSSRFPSISIFSSAAAWGRTWPVRRVIRRSAPSCIARRCVQARGHRGGDRTDAGIWCGGDGGRCGSGFSTTTSPQHNGEAGFPCLRAWPTLQKWMHLPESSPSRARGR